MAADVATAEALPRSQVSVYLDELVEQAIVVRHQVGQPE
jgi:hypothetical protein